MSDLIGKSLGRYHILEQLGEGGMAIVYKAYDTRLETDVAVKVIRTENILPSVLDRALKRFEREAKTLARLTHPNIVKVTDYGEYEGKPYLVMPYLPGGTLKQKLGKPIPWQEAIQILLPIAEALDYAHSQNMIHRDVKPSNILLTERGQPMLTDFGIAKILDSEETQDLTGTSVAVGTPEYMAPEQATAKTVDHRADVYALGIVLYEMVTGKKPYTADTPVAVLIKQATEPLPRPKQSVSNLPDEVEKVLLKAVAKDPEDRYQSMGEMANGIGKLLSNRSQPTEQKRRVLGTESPKVSPKSVVLLNKSMLGIGLLVAILALLAMFGLRALINEPAPTPAMSDIAGPTSTYSPESETPTQIQTNTPVPLPSEIIDVQGVKMVLVSEGEFVMGSNNGAGPTHTVYLDAFYIDKYEVTNARYKACVDAGTCDLPRSTGRYDVLGSSNHPVIYVNWYQAQTYCEWRGVGLPTEAQWEKAARGVDGRTYPWGEETSCDRANFLGKPDNVFPPHCVGNTTEVGSYQSGMSPYAVYDMIGNVWEWVSDWYSEDYYQISPSSNPVGPDVGENRVIRGGSFGDRASTFSRWPVHPSDEYGGIVGFRCARDTNP